MGKIAIVVCYDGRWDEKKCYVDNKILGVLVDEDIQYSFFLELVYNELSLDIFKQQVNLFVNMRIESTENSIWEIKSDSALKWFLSIAKDDKDMKFPLIICAEKRRSITSFVGGSSNFSNEFVGSTSFGNQGLFEEGGCSYSSNEASSSVTNSSISTDYEFVDGHEVEDLKEKYMFADKNQLKKALQLIAIRKNFEFKTNRSDDRRLIVQCIAEGCSWFMRASRYKGGELWLVRKYINEHTCSLDIVVGDHKQASSFVIGELVKRQLNFGVKGCVAPSEIIDHMRVNHGVNISYAKARRARKFAMDFVRGSPKESYAMLPSYLFALKKSNPGSVTDYHVDDDGRFEYVFMCLGASIEGFRFCHPVICVDGTFLTGDVRGTLYIASCIDANNQIFPLAFGVGDSENDLAWQWFFERLKIAIGVPEELVFVTDRHKSIENAISIVFPSASHGICVYHLLNNLKSRYKFVGKDDLFNKCCRAYLVTEFHYYFRQIEEMQRSVADYLREKKFERWARAFFVRKRFNIMTSNISESLNSALRFARELPVAALLEHIRLMCQKWFHTRRMAAASTFTELSTWAEMELRKRKDLSRTMKVHNIAFHKYQVVDLDSEFVVDLVDRLCSCRKWELDQIPCAHTCAVISRTNLSFYTYVSPLYSKSTLALTYATVINPLGNKCQWDIPNEVAEVIVLPPVDVKGKVGRPKKQRFPSAGEQKRSVTCGRCGRKGHNRKTCKFPVPIALRTVNVKKMKICQPTV